MRLCSSRESSVQTEQSREESNCSRKDPVRTDKILFEQSQACSNRLKSCSNRKRQGKPNYTWKDPIRTDKDYIQVLEDHTKFWKTIDGKAFKSHHPPTKHLALTKVGTSKELDVKIEAIALTVPNTSTENSKANIHQNNWTNMALTMIGRQLDRMEDKLLDQPIKEASISKIQPVDIQPPLSVLDFKLTD
ncbi:hypothetical protein GIB67_015104 [Kingdonia uniflora]|uniref:Uncharacterized protein n=1 Tax=Kingdonia uniflora TaxID=39325 RepID=A0A7J7LJB0_9MAGN|nr:hypothetical protein GIB67_015104 [Kingdonia uniflora]